MLSLSKYGDRAAANPFKGSLVYLAERSANRRP